METGASWEQPLQCSDHFGQPWVPTEQLVSFQPGFAASQAVIRQTENLPSKALFRVPGRGRPFTCAANGFIMRSVSTSRRRAFPRQQSEQGSRVCSRTGGGEAVASD